MMKHFMILIALFCFINVQAQKITRSYDNVSMSEALRDLNEQSGDYYISFLYNDLEDFRVTTSIKHKSVMEAIMQIIGFYPVRVVKRGESEIYVECTHKTEHHLTGTIIDENRQPVPYANVYLFHPSDSTIIGGGVSNEAGVFVIPYERQRVGDGSSGMQPTVLVRISYVGYKTVYRLCSNEQVGTIQMKPETMTIKGVLVTGERPKVQLQGNSLVMNVEGTVMERMGTAEDVLSRVPTISKKGDVFEILGKGVPLIYLNNRKLTDLQELKNIQSDNIKNIEVIQNPGAQNNDDLKANDVPYDHLQNSGTRRDSNFPKHQANLYYIGKVGQFSIDFNADYTCYKKRSPNQQQELSDNYENRDVNTKTLTRGNMAAEKLIVSHPLWKGQVEVGEEYTNTRWNSSFENAEGYIANSNNEQHESNIAPFVELRQQLGRFQLQAGLRYEHVESDYFVGGQRRSDQSRTYDGLFPSVALSTSIQNVQFSLSYAKRTNRPAYWLLSNDVVYENRLNLQVGNPYLKPVKYHNINAMAMWKWLYLNVNFSHCVDPFLTVVENMEQDSKVNVATTKNYDDVDWFIVTLGAQRNVKLGEGVTWTPQYNVTLMKQWLKTTFNGQEMNLNQPQLSLQLGNIVTLPHDWLLQADFMMHTHGYTGSNFKIEATNAMLSLSVSRDFFKRHFNIKLTGNDLFNQGKGRGTFYFNRMTMTKMEDNDSRCVTLSLRYRFNVTPSKYKGTGAGNAEKNRL